MSVIVTSPGLARRICLAELRVMAQVATSPWTPPGMVLGDIRIAGDFDSVVGVGFADGGAEEEGDFFFAVDDAAADLLDAGGFPRFDRDRLAAHLPRRDNRRKLVGRRGRASSPFAAAIICGSIHSSQHGGGCRIFSSLRIPPSSSRRRFSAGKGLGDASRPGCALS